MKTHENMAIKSVYSDLLSSSILYTDQRVADEPIYSLAGTCGRVQN